MNKKGFTLVELLAIVVILAIIVIIAAPNMTKQLKKSEEETQNILNQKIENAAHIYAAKYYANKLVKNEEVRFTLNDLEQDGLINLKDNCKDVLEEEIIILDGNYDYSNILGHNCYISSKSNENLVVNNTTTTKSTTKPSTTTTQNTTTTTTTRNTTTTTTTRNTTTTTKKPDNYSVLYNGMAEYKDKTAAKSSSNKKTASLKPWVLGYETDEFFQGFAITKKYVYLSTATTTKSVWTTTLTESELKRISSNKYYRINRKTDEKESMINPYAGHAQAFDVATINGNDQLFFNAFPDFSLQLKINNTTYRGAGYQGFAYNKFVNSTKETVPEKALALYKNPSKDKTPASVVNGKNKTVNDYFNEINKVRGNDLTSGNSKYMFIPEIAVDETKNKVAFSTGKKVYIYNLSKLKSNNKNAYVSEFTSQRKGLQGIELYGNTLYMVQGSSKDINNKNKYFTFTIGVYNFTNIKKVTYNEYEFKIDYTQFLSISANNDTYWEVEPEGISIYDGTPYLLLMRTKLKKKGNAYSTVKPYYIDIYTMKIIK